MKIAIVGDYPYHQNKISGGVSEVIYNLVQGLRDFQNVEVYVITCSHEVMCLKEIKEGNVTLRFLPEQKRFGHITLSIFDVIRIRQKLDEIQPDIVHSFEQAKYSYAALKTIYPVVLEVTMMASEEAKYHRSLKQRIRIKSMTYMENFCLKFAKNIILISPYVREYIQEKTKAVFYERHNPVRDEYFELENNEEEDRLLFAGRLIESKGVHVLLEALVKIKLKVPNICFRIAGEILDHKYYEKLMVFITKNKLNKNVIFLGLLNETSLLEEYERCSIFVTPSFHETFGNVAAQAMAACKPVVASRVGGMATYLADGQAGFLVNPGDADQLGERIMRLLLNKKLRSEMGKEGRRFALENFKVAAIVNQNLEIYETILREIPRKNMQCVKANRNVA